MKKLIAVLALAMLILLGCTTLPEGWTPIGHEALLRIGMTRSQVLELVIYPTKINRTITKYGTNEQWIYRLGYQQYMYEKHLYFEDDILTAWQD